MKSFIAALSIIFITFSVIPSAQADHGQRFCRVERRGEGGMPIYYGYEFSRQSSHYGPHYHTNYAPRAHYTPRSNYDRDHEYRHHQSRSGGFRFFSR